MSRLRPLLALLRELADAVRGAGTRVRAFLEADAVEDELDDEIRFHLEMETRKLVARGLSPDEARRRALIDFGGVERFKERTRSQRKLPVMDELARNLRFAARRLLARPVHSLAITGTLALGIGATTAIVSVIDQVLLQPSPFPEPDRLVMIWETDRASGTSHEPASWPDIVDFRERTRSFEEIGAMTGLDVTVLDGELPRQVAGLAVTPSFLRVLGVEPLEGRLFTDEEGSLSDASATVLLGEGYWRDRFDGDPGIVGRTLSLALGPAVVVGVLPAQADLGARQIEAQADYGNALDDGPADLWVAFRPTAEAYPRSTHPFFAVGRLASRTALASARPELESIAADLEREYPENAARGVNLEAYSDVVFGSARSGLLLLLGAVALVLLVAFANVMNLLLAETAERGREVAVRRAFGADSGGIGRQFLTESVLLSLAGTAAGIVLALGGLELILSLAPGDLPRLDEVALDPRVLGLTAGLGTLAALLFGLVPSLSSRTADLQESLRAQSSRRATEGRSARRFRSGLVVAEVALAVVLVVSAGILLRSFWEVRSVDPGFRTERVVKAVYTIPSRYDDFAEVSEMHRAFLDEARRIPGVESVALASSHPLDAGSTNSFVIPGREVESADFPEIRVRSITPEYPEVVGVPVLDGRSLGEGDITGSPAVAMINESAAAQYFSEGGAVGRSIRFWGFEWRIVGVLGDERFRGLDQPVDPAVYLPAFQIPFNRMNILMRSDRNPEALAAEAGRLLRDVDPQIAVADVEPLKEVLDETLTEPRFLLIILGIFAAAAIALALIGVYGVLSHTVARRAPEVGIRLALGASQGDVFREVVVDGVRLTALGAGIGAVGAVAASRTLEGLVFGVSATDVPTYLSMVALILLCATLASVLPALRAARQDPVGLLRAE